MATRTESKPTANAVVSIPGLLHDLLSIRRPHGGTGEALAQSLVEQRIIRAGRSSSRDSVGNIHCVVQPNGVDNDAGRASVLVLPTFTAHLDTVHIQDGQQVLFVIEGTNEVVADTLDGKASVLGADDAAGVYILTEMIAAGVPGRYLFFVGEECGGIGSSQYVLNNPNFESNMVVSFDRKALSSVITHQGWYRTCSDEFATALSSALNLQEPSFEYKPDDSGVYTDSKEFAHIVPECTNISVGYYNEHTTRELLDLPHLLALTQACIKLDWAGLPISREPGQDVPWGTTGDSYSSYGKLWAGDADTPKWNTRAEAKDAVAEIEAMVASGSVTEFEIMHYLNVIKGYLL